MKASVENQGFSEKKFSLKKMRPWDAVLILLSIVLGVINMKHIVFLIFLLGSNVVLAETRQLIEAILSNDTPEAVRILFTTNDYDINKKLDHYNGGWHIWSHTPLTASAEMGNVNLIKILVLFNADIVSQGNQALQNAIRYEGLQYREAVSTLLELGAIPTDATTEYACRRAIHEIPETKNDLDAFIAKGSIITDKCLLGLDKRLYKRYYDISRTQGSNINLQTQLYKFCSYKYNHGDNSGDNDPKLIKSIISTLLGDGAESDLKCLKENLSNEGTPSSMLLTHEALSERDEARKTAIYYARTANAIHALVGAGANVDGGNYKGDVPTITPLKMVIAQIMNLTDYPPDMDVYDNFKRMGALLENHADTDGVLEMLQKIKVSNVKVKELQKALLQTIKHYNRTGKVQEGFFYY